MPGTKKTTQSSGSQEIQKSGVTIRMYDCGFGDCFLLTFHADDGTPRHVLVDFGIHNQYKELKFKDCKERMQKIAKDIADYTGKHLNIVAITHEHADHLLGFRYAKEIFNEIKIDDLWLAWTEDDTDDITKKLKAGIKKGIAELTSGISQLKLKDEQLGSTIEGLLGFELSPGAAGEKETELQLLRDWRRKVNKKPLCYCRPGQDPLTIPGVRGVKVYVLGPPKNIAEIKNVEDNSELYPEFAGISEFRSFITALEFNLGEGSAEDEAAIKQTRPFDISYSVLPNDEKTDKKYRNFFQEFFGFSGEKGQGEEWRRIDNDWLATAGELALKLNSYTNNTSLVLAFELPDTKKILLFTGDAQVGNWLSWHDEKTVKVDAKDILHRTGVYKVGHHGSRNATLREKGLDMMDDPGLVAMIPVDEYWAKNKSQPWEHPAEKLLNAIEEKTKNRILRMDKIPSISEEVKKLPTMEESERKNFLEKVKCDDSGDNLWVEYTIER